MDRPDAPEAAPDQLPQDVLRHELRTPLNQIIGYSELLQEEAKDRGDERMVADLKHIETAGRRLLELINGLLSSGATGTEQAALGLTTDSAASRRTEPPASVPAPEPRPSSAGLRPLATVPTLAAKAVSARLLVVDDSEANRDMLARRLEQSGHLVATADGGEMALALLGREHFDLVVLDVMMPGMSGLEVLVRLREQKHMADLPVVMATARDRSDDVVEALRLGANDYVTKPLDMPVVLARIEAQLSLKQARDEVSGLNRRLADAQQQIARLVSSAPEALLDLASWASGIATDIARTIAAEVSVFLLEKDGPKRLGGGEVVPPTSTELSDIEHRPELVRAADILLPVKGFSGKLVGVIAVAPSTALGTEEATRLVGSFAAHLGGVLELRDLQHQLSMAAEQRRASRQQLLDRGVEVLQICPCCGLCYNHRVERCAKDGSILYSPRPAPCVVAGRYRLLQVLGRGGMGEIYRAHDRQLDREVAIKVLLPRLFDDETARLRFRQEAFAVARIRHSGVVAVHDFGEMEDGSMFIVMELLHGADLGTLMEHYGPGTPAQVAELLRQGSAALAAAHEAAIIHRDIKPANILVSGGPSALQFKLLDFGIAKELSSKGGLTQTGDIMGTPRYMAPEQLMGKAVDARSDLYSFAAVGYEALCGRPVAESEEFGRVLIEVLQNVAPKVSQFLLAAPPEVDRAFARALAKQPEERPAGVQEWVASFVEVLAAVPPTTAGWPTTREARSESGASTMVHFRKR